MEYVSGNIFIREMKFEKAGQVIEGHAHNFDHTTYIVNGSFVIEQITPTEFVEGVPTKFETVRSVTKRAGEGHNWVLIKAGAYHRITALEDNTIGHCIYAHRTPQGSVVEEYDGWQQAYE